ncbi:GNAT family N-acetyltransferase [candidate division KSB1 bacterium]|nr:GNAT family N-acetyltransferase [candidate division KSB1 bacterium]RQW04321.1 MAG: N-acetyltransferase [candidate division KSB1 bacterium]
MGRWRSPALLVPLSMLKAAKPPTTIERAGMISECIRRAREEECSVLADLVRNSFQDVANQFNITSDNCPTHPSNCTAEWIRNECKKGTEYFILLENSTAIGCVALERANREVYYLERLAVLPAYRERGYGHMLVDYCLEQARARQAKRVETSLIADHWELVEWYRRLGFRFKQRARFNHLPFAVTFMYYDLEEQFVYDLAAA